MMHDFMNNNRDELTRRCREKVAKRPGRAATEPQLRNGVPMFLDQLIRTLEMEQTDDRAESQEISGPSGGGPAVSEIGTTAALHGRELLALGFNVDQVVHDYGDLCQAITDLAFERDVPFMVDEFRTLNRCLDNAIAQAVGEFSRQRDLDVFQKRLIVEKRLLDEINERQGLFVHELRNALHTALLGFTAVKTGNLSLSGATGAVIERSLASMRALLDVALNDVRQASGDMEKEQFSVARFIDDIQSAGELAPKVRGTVFVVHTVDEQLAVLANRETLYSAIWNLLQNAFKFTRVNTEVTLSAYATAEHVVIDVTDQCGGLPPGTEEKIFSSFSQFGEDRSGLGLGLTVVHQCVTANGGTVSVRDTPGVGCTFKVSLPRQADGQFSSTE